MERMEMYGNVWSIFWQERWADLTCTLRAFFSFYLWSWRGPGSLHFLRVLENCIGRIYWKGNPPIDSGRGSFRATFAKLSPTFRKISDKRWSCNETLQNPHGNQPKPSWNILELFVSNSYLQGILPQPSRNLPEHTLQLQFHSSIHEQTRSLHFSFGDFRGARLLLRSFANQHFPFARAPQVNSHI